MRHSKALLHLHAAFLDPADGEEVVPAVLSQGKPGVESGVNGDKIFFFDVKRKI